MLEFFGRKTVNPISQFNDPLNEFSNAWILIRMGGEVYKGAIFAARVGQTRLKGV